MGGKMLNTHNKLSAARKALKKLEAKRNGMRSVSKSPECQRREQRLRISETTSLSYSEFNHHSLMIQMLVAILRWEREATNIGWEPWFTTKSLSYSESKHHWLIIEMLIINFRWEREATNIGWEPWFTTSLSYSEFNHHWLTIKMLVANLR